MVELTRKDQASIRELQMRCSRYITAVRKAVERGHMDRAAHLLHCLESEQSRLQSDAGHVRAIAIGHKDKEQVQQSIEALRGKRLEVVSRTIDECRELITTYGPVYQSIKKHYELFKHSINPELYKNRGMVVIIKEIQDYVRSIAHSMADKHPQRAVSWLNELIRLKGSLQQPDHHAHAVLSKMMHTPLHPSEQFDDIRLMTVSVVDDAIVVGRRMIQGK